MKVVLSFFYKQYLSFLLLFLQYRASWNFLQYSPENNNHGVLLLKNQLRTAEDGCFREAILPNIWGRLFPYKFKLLKEGDII